VINVTHFHCDAREPAIPADEKTHHLVPKKGVQTCLFCHKTERELREELTTKAELERLSVPAPTLPEGLCGVERLQSIRRLTDTKDRTVVTGKCVFLANHEGEHSWEQ